MKSAFIDSKEANNKVWAYFDARMRAAVNWTTYSASQKLRAERMVLGLSMVYRAKSIYITPRKTFIAVKVDGPVVVNKSGLAVLEKDYEKEGIQKLVSRQGVIYRIPRA